MLRIFDGFLDAALLRVRPERSYIMWLRDNAFSVILWCVCVCARLDPDARSEKEYKFNPALWNQRADPLEGTEVRRLQK